MLAVAFEPCGHHAWRHGNPPRHVRPGGAISAEQDHPRPPRQPCGGCRTPLEGFQRTARRRSEQDDQYRFATTCHSSTAPF
jgi:hypothetical protein